MTSLRNKIYQHLKEKYPAIVHGGELERLGMDLGFKASNAGRRCRELENDGLIERIMNSRREVQYKWIQTAPKKEMSQNEMARLWQ